MADNMDKNEPKEDSKALRQGRIQEEFKEIAEVQELISNLPNIYLDQIASEMSCERFTVIIDDYQEQPHLIDPHLEKLMNQILTIGRNPHAPAGLRNQAFKYLYLITKMRGAKVVVRLFPHEVTDLEPVLALLSQQDSEDIQAWETRYILLLWLSMACMIPFDLVKLDGAMQKEGGDGKRPIMDRIYDLAKQYITVSDKAKDAAAYLMSRFMTRPDIKKQKLPEFLDWCSKFIDEAEYATVKGTIKLTGVLTTIGQLFKNGKREDLLQYASLAFNKVQSLNLSESTNTDLRKVGVKVIQRLGLTFLKNRVAKWRYQRGSRSLSDNLKLNKEAVKARARNPDSQQEEGEEEEYDIADEIEEIIEILLTSLRDKDTVVRWSAAKGIGRITGRLPRELADEVVGSLMDLFTLQESDGAWQGGCMALAELGRRGLLLPCRLKDVVPIVLRALAYDEKRGYYSVGVHVRDAACYVCWAFARAYEPSDIQAYVGQISSALVVATLFDREVNVRRAAAAAFQENVGRQGTFPHGIDILTTADYFAVGNRSNCYLVLSLYVAQFPDYTDALIKHLADVKVSHWDTSIRELTARALHLLTDKSPDFVSKTVLPSLLSKTLDIDLHLRHGAILSVAEVTYALAKVAKQQNKDLLDILGSEVVTGLKNLVKKMHDAQMFKGMSGELMRKAVCCLIERLSLSHLPFHEDPIIDLWQDILDDCLNHTEPDIQLAAVSALPAFFTEYYQQPSGTAKPDKQEMVIGKYIRQLQSNIEVTRIGYSQALGVFPKFMLHQNLRAVLSSLIKATEITPTDEKMTQSRKSAIQAIAGVCVTVGVEPDGNPAEVLCSANIGQVYDAFLVGLHDYTLDNRGDVGAWVRESSMSSILTVTALIVQKHPQMISPKLSEHIFVNLCQQACEKIDRTRGHAGSIFAQLLYHNPPIPHIPEEDGVKQIFVKDQIADVNWQAPGDSFPLFVKLLKFPVYTYHVLLGLTISIGGLTESLVKYSSAAFYQFIRELCLDINNLNPFLRVIIQIFQKNKKVDRVSIPMLKMLDQLFARGCFDVLIEAEGHFFPLEITDLVKQEAMKSKDPNKLLAAADVYCGLLQFRGEVRRKCLAQIVILLCHRYPRIRKTTANKLYEVLVTYDDIAPPDNLEEVMLLLSETLWDNELEEIRPIRNNICTLLDVPVPVQIKKPA